jgi:uncharacterized membrane protein
MLGIILFASSILHTALAAFSARNFLMSDYGVYTNTIWNLSHFNGFNFLIDHNYLKTHLSFSLIFLAPFFWIFNSPLTLIFLQWSFMITGAVFILKLAKKINIPFSLSLPIAFMFIAYPFMQSIMLSEFHGVSLYLFLIPWLIYNLETKKKLVILPFIIILGLREDAGFMLPLIFLYYAIRDKWKGGYIFAGSSIIYSCLAIFVFYPLITGESLLTIRSSEATAASILNTWEPGNIITRLQATGWVFLICAPVLIFNFKKSLPLLIFPLLPYLFSMLSGYHRQHSLEFHYSAIIMATLIPAIIISLKPPLKSKRKTTILSILIIIVTITAHLINGFILNAPRTHKVYKKINIDGIHILDVASHIKKKGILVCNQKLAVFCANRENIVTWRYWKSDEHPADSFFLAYRELINNKDVITLLENGIFGVKYYRLPYIVLERGYSTEKNSELLKLTKNYLVLAAYTHKHAGNNIFIDNESYRHWSGNGNNGSHTILYGQNVILKPGKYNAIFKYRAKAMQNTKNNTWGKFSIHEMNQQANITEEEIIKSATTNFITQTIAFDIEKEMRIEPRVITGYAKLWISTISFKNIESNTKSTVHDSQ